MNDDFVGLAAEPGGAPRTGLGPRPQPASATAGDRPAADARLPAQRLADAELRALVLERELRRMRRSVSWRLTRPLRGLAERLAPLAFRDKGTTASAGAEESSPGWLSPLADLPLWLMLRVRPFRWLIHRLHQRRLLTTRTFRRYRAVVQLRSTTLLDREWYRAEYGRPGRPMAHPVVDYVRSTRTQPRRPNRAFDDALYIAKNPGLQRDIAAGTYISGFHHFVEQGQHELGKNFGRRLSLDLDGRLYDFDPGPFLEDNPDVAAMVARGLFRSAVDYLMQGGIDEIGDGRRTIYAAHRSVRKRVLLDGEALPSAGRNYLCLFAHFDRDRRIDPYVIVYLQTLRAAGVDVVFISATDDPEELAKISPYCIKILVKNEAGRDFGSWYLAIKALSAEGWDDYDSLIFANDSVYFPIHSPKTMFDTMPHLGFQMWGMTDSHEGGAYHIQSYFLVFDRTAQAEVLPEFIRHYERCPYLSKTGQVQEFEFGLTRIARERGLRVGALCPIDTIRDRVLRNDAYQPWQDRLRLGVSHINPSHDLWDLIVPMCGFPALKIELIRDNPKRVGNIAGWPRLVDPACLDPALIRGHLKRITSEPQLARARLLPAEPRLSTTGDTVVKAEVPGRGFGRAPGLVLFANFDVHGVVDDHVLTSLRALVKAGNDIVFVTPSDDPRQIRKLEGIVATTLIKQSSGSDFGSWYLALMTHLDNIKSYQSVMWMNDSNYFPLFDVSEMFSKMENRHLDFWGGVDCYALQWHTMSWLWWFGKRLLTDAFFESFISDYNSNYMKWDTISNYEARYPDMLRRRGYKTGSYVSSDDVFQYLMAQKKRHPCFYYTREFNMMHDFWDMIISEFRCPALKVELLRDNPLGIDLSEAYAFLATETTYDVGLIRAHLARVKGTAPLAASPVTAAAAPRAVTAAAAAVVPARLGGAPS